MSRASLIAFLFFSACGAPQTDDTQQETFTPPIPPPSVKAKPSASTATHAEADDETSNETTDMTQGADPEPIPQPGADDDPEQPGALVPQDAELLGTRFGTTWRDRPMIVERFGDSGPLMLIFAAIHGDERTALTVAELFRSKLLAGLAEEEHAQVLLVQQTNPDGIAISKRYNWRDVNLNRNYDTANFIVDDRSGPSPASEQETQAMQALVVDYDPRSSISLHAPINGLDYDGPALDMAQAMSQASGFAVHKLVAYPGSFGSFMGVDMMRPAVTFELAQSYSALSLYTPALTALRAGVWYTAQNLPDTTARAFTDTGGYVAWRIGTSAGGRVLRADATTRAPTDPVLIVGGWSGASTSALYVAERLRQRLFIADHEDAVAITGANPDGIWSADDKNSNGAQVSRSFTSIGTAETRAVRATIARAKPRLIISIEPGDSKSFIANAAAASLEFALSHSLAPSAAPLGDTSVEQTTDIPAVRFVVPSFNVENESQVLPYLNALDAIR